MNKITLIICVLATLLSCKSDTENTPMSEEHWKLGWRMIENSWEEKYDIAESQFDSLLALNQDLDHTFLVTGLEVKSILTKNDEVIILLSKQSDETRALICNQSFAKVYELCNSQVKEIVENEELQLRVINLFVDDQAIRGNIMHDIIDKYNIDTAGIKTQYDWSDPEEQSIDEINRNHLKLIFEEYGFPTKALIGKDAMRGIFFIIQHADGDKEWQKNQLPKLEQAAKNGDLSKQNYAYLFDRIKVNEGSPQKYGSQFKTVDREKGIAILQETEDIEYLNQRRREMGMMPIEIYRRLMLRQ